MERNDKALEVYQALTTEPTDIRWPCSICVQERAMANTGKHFYDDYGGKNRLYRCRVCGYVQPVTSFGIDSYDRLA